MHGVLIDVIGVGVLILGKSGIGKSELALDLVTRGHRLVADDIVDLKRRQGGSVYGSGSEIIKHHMEIRGIGIINIKDLFGVSAVRERKKVEMVVELVEWDRADVIVTTDLDPLIVTAVPGGDQEALVRRRYLLADAHGDPGARVPRDFNPHVSEGGLDPRPWWYIPKRGIYHQPKVTRKGPPGPAIRRRKDAAAPARPGRSRRVNCGNDGGGQPDWSRGPGPDCGSRLPALDHQGSTVTASRCCPAVPAPQPQPRKPAQMTVPPS